MKLYTRVLYHCERGALGTCHGLTILDPHSRIQKQRLGGPVPKPPESTTFVGDGGEGVDGYGRYSADAVNAL